jgi:hypothetical protein
MNDQLIARYPMARRPVNPVPKAIETRPGARAARVAVAAALVIGCRRLGTRTPGPRPIRSVRCAARASVIHTSGLCCGVS